MENVWFHSGYAPEHAVERLLPDGAVELIVDLTEEPKRLHDNADPMRGEWFRRGWISGMQREYLLIGPGRDSSLAGVRFLPGGVAPFLPGPAAAIAGRVVELELVFGAAARRLRDQLLGARTIEQKFDVLERFLLERAADELRPDALVGEALRRLVRTAGRLTIERLSADLGTSQRRLIRLFDEQVGLKPKAVHRIFRFVRTIQLVEGQREVDWARVALECGFHDQAHFSREFRAFSGFTPTEYLRRRGDLPFYVYHEDIDESDEGLAM